MPDIKFKIDKNKINDKNLIERILKNSRKKDFDFEDSSYIVKNKNFIIMQLLSILTISSLIITLLIALNFIYAYLGIIFVLIYIIIIYKKFIIVENKVIEENFKLETAEIKEEIKEKLSELFSLMNNIKIEIDRIKYTQKKFEIKLTNCKTKKDYETLLSEIIDDIIKYKNVSGSNKFKMNNNNPFDEANIAYKELGLDQTASYEEIKKRYRDLIKECHPDIGIIDSSKVIKINNAYNILKKIKK